jgi:hypothetical protein
LVEINKRYFWHNIIEEVKDVVISCKQCQLVKSTGCIRLDLVELKTIPIWDQLYRVALDIVGPLLETKLGNMYVLVAIDHYSK